MPECPQKGVQERFEEVGKKIKRETTDDFLLLLHKHQMRLCPAGRTLNTTTPCAACKLLRRRCAQECPFSPYFSPQEPHKFASVHKVFGASNVSKMLMEVPESQRADAANSLVYEANVRLRDPIYGCMGAISTLQQQVQLLHAELNAVRAEITKYKYIDTNNTNLPSSHITLLPSGAVSIATPPPPPPQPPAAIPLCSSSPSIIYTRPVTSSIDPDFSTNMSTQNVTYLG